MSRTGDWIIELMEKGEWEEEPNGYDYTPYDYATSQPEWVSVFGEATGLIFQVIQTQGIPATASDLYYRAANLAVDVIAHKRILSLKEAHIEMGCELPKPIEGVPF